MKKRSILLLLILFQIALTIGSCDSRHAAEKPDTTRPAVMATSPSNGATAVAINEPPVTITFSKAMNPATINWTTFVLTSTTTGTVAGAVTYDTASHVATFTSSTVLDHNVKHVAAIASTVSDLAGNTLGSPYSWSFTTIPAPGALDASFGTNGKVRMSIGPGNDIAYALAIQQDGKIVAAGLSSLASSPSSTEYFTITRFLTSGASDTTFGLNPGRADYFIGSASSVALQSDGKIVAAGSNVVSMSSLTSPADFLIARYNIDGTRDTSLNSNGTVTMNTGGYVHSVVNSVALQSDNMIVVAGEGTNDASTFVSIVARFTTTGALDTSFNTTGVIITDTIGTTSRAKVVKVQPDDGKIVVGGDYQDGSGPQSFYLSRFAMDGTPDVLFSSGTITASPGTNAVLADIAFLSGGKILVAGTTNIGSDDIFLMRYNADGTLDTTFGTNGIVITDDGNNGVETATGLAVQQDGKIVVAATFNPTTGPTQTKDFALFRYNADGTEDSTFGNGYGMVLHTDFGYNYDDIAGEVQIQQDGKLVEVGCAWNGLNCDIGLARFWP